MKAVATVEQVTAGKRIRGRVYIVLERPSTIRFDAMSPADTPLSILVANDERFSMLDVSGNVHYTGPSSPCNVSRLVAIPMSPSAIVGILTGNPPLIESTQHKIETAPKGYHLLELFSAGGDVKQTVQMVTGMMGTSAIRSVVWRGETVISDLRFKHRVQVGKDGPALPRRIELTMPGRGTFVVLEYTSVQIDPDVDPAVFELAFEPGIPVVSVDCDDPQ